MGLRENFNAVWGTDDTPARDLAWRSAQNCAQARIVYATLAGERTLPPHKHHWAHGKEWPTKRRNHG